MPTRSDWVVVFDLDDTLYKEADFVDSGIHAVAAVLRSVLGVDIHDELMMARASGITDLWGHACGLLNMPQTLKHSMLWVYRLHTPAISLDVQTQVALAVLKSSGHELAILTDGRSLTQRNKLRALGLQDLPVFISEEFGSEKPELQRYLAVMERWRGRNYAYIGDNPQKDFIAPNRLGWLTCCLRGDARNVYPQERCHIALGGEPVRWLDRIDEISKYLC